MPLGSEQVRFDFAEELEKRNFTEAAREEREFIMQTGWYRYWYVSNLISESASEGTISGKHFFKPSNAPGPATTNSISVKSMSGE